KHYDILFYAQFMALTTIKNYGFMQYVSISRTEIIIGLPRVDSVGIDEPEGRVLGGDPLSENTTTCASIINPDSERIPWCLSKKSRTLQAQQNNSRNMRDRNQMAAEILEEGWKNPHVNVQKF
ncbi:hypothetical protein ACJX0J_040126, partial [Zea mays]